MGGIWEHRSDVNRGVPRRTARYGTGATCSFSVSGGRGRARAALGVKATYRQVKGSRSLPGPLRSGSGDKAYSVGVISRDPRWRVSPVTVFQALAYRLALSLGVRE
jgi:hypothetical protein